MTGCGGDSFPEQRVEERTPAVQVREHVRLTHPIARLRFRHLLAFTDPFPTVTMLQARAPFVSLGTDDNASNVSVSSRSLNDLVNSTSALEKFKHPLRLPAAPLSFAERIPAARSCPTLLCLPS